MSAFTTVNLYHTNAEPLKFNQGDVIFREGETGDEMYALMSGAVGLWVNDCLVEIISEGDVFGEGALVQPSHTRASRAIAHTNCELIPLNHSRFLFVCQNTPMFAIEVMRSFSDRLRLLKEKLAEAD
ncbi:Crp/Fnr family transcriptional regulator [Lyngbya confervoides]|uniref:Crp/Fnr family transcriptional regulator n=1 Tax=Lyngbya confervoides BDU141951 TaxID=1574623 RepID=A0ABD4T6B3_9CYAN|nr:Crp/Fnr family transcriptional regulator [Lyngbya confervoides]MCM1983989.1 Crp/Fnr family transcriptional regulator [Lyngbya confervoides BDU141951]